MMPDPVRQAARYPASTPACVDWCDDTDHIATNIATNIDIDGSLVAEVMRRYRLEAKRGAVDFALRNLIEPPQTREEVLSMPGSGIEFDNAQVEGFDNAQVERGWSSA